LWRKLCGLSYRNTWPGAASHTLNRQVFGFFQQIIKNSSAENRGSRAAAKRRFLVPDRRGAGRVFVVNLLETALNPLLLSTALTLLVTACSTSRGPDSSRRSLDATEVIGKTWQWQGTATLVEKITVEQPEHYTFKLSENGRAEFRFDCNRGGGDYQISEGKLSFGPIMSTRMACPQGSLDSSYAKQLQEVAAFFIENNELYLNMPADKGILHFKVNAMPQ